MSNENPTWVNKIRSGQFDAAADELTSAAAQRVNDTLIAQQVNAEVARINTEAGELGKYCVADAQQRVQQAYNQGKISSPGALVDAYRSAMQESISEFRTQWDHARSPYSPGIPADESVREYVQSRRAEKARLIEEGKRIPNVQAK